MRRFLRANPATAVTRTTLAMCELPQLRRPLSCPIATLSVTPSTSSLWVAHRTCSSSATPSTTSAGLAHRGNDHSSYSGEGGADLAHVGEGEEHGAEEEVENGSFDACEAACQELHDVTHAMIGHLRRTATIGDPQVLTHRRIPKRMNRETVPGHLRRTHQGIPSLEQSGYATKKQLEDATQLFLQLGEKLLLLLTPEHVERLLQTTKQQSERLNRRDGVHYHKSVVARMQYRRYPVQYYKHAPFELQQLRSDMPSEPIQAARAARDRGTLMRLMTLMEAPNVYREALEKRMWSITEAFDPLRPKSV